MSSTKSAPETKQVTKAEPMDPPAQKPFKMVLMAMNEALTRAQILPKFGFVGDTIYARQPVGTGGNSLGSDYMDLQTIKEGGLEETPLYYLLKPVGVDLPEFDLADQTDKLKTGIPGYIKMYGERNPGKSMGEAYGALLSLPSVYAAAQSAVTKLAA